MGVQIDLCIQKGSRELPGIGNRMPPAEFVRVKFGVVLGRDPYCPCFSVWRLIQLSISLPSNRSESPA
jgi:hypothetical protein